MCGRVIQAKGPIEYAIVDGLNVRDSRLLAILKPESYDRWLGVEPDPRDLLMSYPAEPMRIWPISKRVNTPKNDDATLLDPVQGEAA